jgi:hypothetical protein
MHGQENDRQSRIDVQQPLQGPKLIPSAVVSIQLHVDNSHEAANIDIQRPLKGPTHSYPLHSCRFSYTLTTTAR